MADAIHSEGISNMGENGTHGSINTEHFFHINHQFICSVKLTYKWMRRLEILESIAQRLFRLWLPKKKKEETRGFVH